MDAGVYARTVGENKVYITVYVDNLLILGTEFDVEMGLAKLRSKFKIKDVGPVKHLLRMEISYMPSVVCQFHSASTLRRVWLGLK